MAAISSNGTGGGLASATATWAGGVVPTSADDVTIVTGDTVTMDGTFDVNTLVVNGVFKASHTSSSVFNIHSSANNTTAFTVNGSLDFGTELSPIPSGVTVDIHIIDPTAIINFLFANGADVTMVHAVSRDNSVVLTADAAINDTIINVSSSTNWAAGDSILIESIVQGNSTSVHTTTIASISGNQITMADAVGYALDGTIEPMVVVNRTNPINVYGDGTGRGRIQVNRTSSSTFPKTKFKNVTIHSLGRNTWMGGAFYLYGGSDNTGQVSPAVNGYLFDHVVLFNCYYGAAFEGVGSTCNDVVVLTDGTYTSGTAFYFYYSCLLSVTNFTIFNNGKGLGYSPSGSTFANVTAVNTPNLINSLSAYNFVIDGGTWRHLGGWIFQNFSNCDATFYNVDIVDFAGIAWNVWGSGGYAGDLTFIGGNQVNFLTLWDSSQAYSSYGQHRIRQLNYNNNPKAQHLLTHRGAIERDYLNPISADTPVASIAVTPHSSDASGTDGEWFYENKVSVAIGGVLTASVLVDVEASFTGSLKPTLEILGETNQSVTMTNAPGSPETLSLATAPAVTAHVATVRVSAKAAFQKLWIDDLKINNLYVDLGQEFFPGGTEISNVVDITITGKTLSFTNIVPGSIFVIYDLDNADPQNLGTELQRNNTALATEQYSYDVAKAGDDVEVVVYLTGYKPYSAKITLGASDSSFTINQLPETN